MNSLKKKGAILVLMLGLFTLAGCSSQSAQNPSAQNGVVTPIDVTFSTQPASPVKSGEKVKIIVTVKQNNQLVEDAASVKFEIWKDQQEKHDMVVAKLGLTGDYFVERTFDASGTYFVMYHVTARDMHKMKQMELKVE